MKVSKARRAHLEVVYESKSRGGRGWGWVGGGQPAARPSPALPAFNVPLIVLLIFR